jgi:DNA-directed RNA polymerase subunit alpha
MFQRTGISTMIWRRATSRSIQCTHPVKKVNYNVEAARLGQNTEFDKLTIEVWTDGSMKPEDSIGLAAKLIKDHMSIFINFEKDIDDFA